MQQSMSRWQIQNFSQRKFACQAFLIDMYHELQTKGEWEQQHPAHEIAHPQTTLAGPSPPPERANEDVASLSGHANTQLKDALSSQKKTSLPQLDESAIKPSAVS